MKKKTKQNNHNYRLIVCYVTNASMGSGGTQRYFFTTGLEYRLEVQ